MRFWREVGGLIQKELQLEWKQKYAIYGLGLYAITMVLVVSLGLQRSLPMQAWNVIFWIILLFISVNAVAKSFMGESPGQLLYLYNLAGPRAIITAKLIYNCLLMAAIAMLTLLFYVWLAAGAGIAAPGQYCVAVIIGSWTFAANLTLVSAIAARAQNKSTLLAVLSFPLVVPQMLVSISVSGKAILGQPWSDMVGELGFSISFIVIIAAVSVILFPYIWRE
ncbi:MAG: heme exporter protein CcmB [Bacteroidota bacterium]